MSAHRRRATVVAAPALAARLPTVLAAAERAATVVEALSEQRGGR